MTTFEYDDFSCELVSIQCQAETKKKVQCKRRTRRQLPYCADHTRILFHVAIKPSTIKGAGFGVFALKDFEKDERIIPYFGELIDEAELNRRYGDKIAPYAFKVGKGKYIDGACERGTANYINTNFKKNNAVLKSYPGNSVKDIPPSGFVKATKKIHAGQEIFVDYGADSAGYLHLEHKTS